MPPSSNWQTPLRQLCPLAQLASFAYAKASGGAEDMRDNAWFVGFAPRDNPEIVVAALFEHGGHGQFAAAIVRDVLKAHFDKKERVTQLQQNQNRTVAALGLGLQGSVGGTVPTHPVQ